MPAALRRSPGNTPAALIAFSANAQMNRVVIVGSAARAADKKESRGPVLPRLSLTSCGRVVYCFCCPRTPRLESISTLIWRGFVSAFLGRTMRSTPSRLCAVTCSNSTVVGKVKLRLKLP